jgi:hypothetical protein
MVSKTAPRIRCSHCRAMSPEAAAVCSSCGVALRVVKDRSIAILLAVFFSFISWTYTFARNWPKFWIGLVLTLLSGTLASAQGGAWLIPGFAVWLWAIVDNAGKPTEYYLQFPVYREWQDAGFRL